MGFHRGIPSSHKIQRVLLLLTYVHSLACLAVQAMIHLCDHGAVKTLISLCAPGFVVGRLFLLKAPE